MKSRTLISTMALACTISLAAAEMDFSYNAFGESPDWFGYKKSETYDVGIRIADPELTGKKITGISVRINGTSENISTCKGWLSAELTAETIDKTSLFTPDIASIDGTFSDGIMTVTFAQPYTITEEGVYIGYSYELAQPTEIPIKTVATADGNAQGGLWFHSSTSQKTWADMAKRNGIVSAMIVKLEGEFQADCAMPVFSEEPRIAEGEAYRLPIEIASYGLNGLSSIDYTYEIGATKGSGTYSFDEPVTPAYGRKAYAAIELDPVEGLGEKELTVTITKVNGKLNEASAPTTSTSATVQKFVPVYRPLVEEYTGLNCGYCPRGYVMLEDMKAAYADRFVGLSYHSSGWESNAMDCINPADFPANPSGYPAASLNRTTIVDPDKIPALWEKVWRNETQAEVQIAEWLWADEDHTTLKATAKARFLKDYEEAGYRIAFVMLADGLKNEKWIQSNYYSDQKRTDEYSSPYWDLFIGQPDHVEGLKFNDIVVYATDFHGIEESLPTSIESGEWYEYSIEINPDDITNRSGTHIVNNFDLTRMVAIIVDGNTGAPLNCISSSYPSNGTGVEFNKEEGLAKDVYFYDLQGRRIANPDKGIYIKVEMMEDGSVRTSKNIK